MADGRKNNGGKRKGAGNPGYGKLADIISKANKFSPLFWTKLNTFIKSKDKVDVKFAITEFNKIQVRMIPQDITTGGQPFNQMNEQEVKNALAEKLADLLKK